METTTKLVKSVVQPFKCRIFFWDWSCQFGLEQLSVQNSSGFLDERIGSVVFLLLSSEKNVASYVCELLWLFPLRGSDFSTHQFLASLGAREDLLK